ncbi:MAG TPA: ATP-binding protein [Bryobacteraceae bacterium]|jgi:signal transduction histidine kinase|nr:ATP-binding protein [Bryobacteraceae bacterium]
MSPTSPTRPLLVGLAITLLAVAVFSWYALSRIEVVRGLQTHTIDRNRQDSLQLLRIQNNFHSLALAMRDMVEGSEPYPLESWKIQFDRIRFDLEDALNVEARIAPITRRPDQQKQFAVSLLQFWNSADQMFALARAGKESEARAFIRTSLESQQASLTSTVARLLVLNNETEQLAALAVQQIYDRVERRIYWFVMAALITICVTSLYLIRANRVIFDRLAALSDQRQVLARKLIGVQEEILHSVSRELHDEFGQILTAVGAMLGRAGKHLPPDSTFRIELSEVREIAQSTLERLRSLSQALHPSILDDYGLEKALEWYVTQFGKQTGIVIRYEKQGPELAVGGQEAIHVYRILQETLNNVARHSKSTSAWVRLFVRPEGMRLEVEDHGVGMPERGGGGLGLIAMRERAEILQGKLEWLRPPQGGTLVILEIPAAQAAVV